MVNSKIVVNMAYNLGSECLSAYNTWYPEYTDERAFRAPVKKIDKNEAINRVRKLLRTKARNISIPELEDEFILTFLHSRKMDVDSCFQQIFNYFAFRKNNPQLFENLNSNDPSIQNCIEDGLPSVLKNKDRNGRCVLFLAMYQWDHAKYSVETIYRSLISSMEYLLTNVQNQLFGFVFIVDWTNFTFRDYVDISPKILKLIIDGFQDSFPARIKSVHFVGQPWYINGVLTVIKPFLKEKTKQKLIIHGSNLNALHEHVPRDVLTPELGGEGEAFTPKEWIEKLRSHESGSQKPSIPTTYPQKKGSYFRPENNS